MKQAIHLFYLFEPDSDMTLAILSQTQYSIYFLSICIIMIRIYFSITLKVQIFDKNE